MEIIEYWCKWHEKPCDEVDSSVDSSCDRCNSEIRVPYEEDEGGEITFK